MSKLRVWGLEDFVATKLGQPMFLVTPIIPTGAKMGLIFGRRGSGKSHLAFSLARAIADGEDFLGIYKTRQGKVCYLSVDMPLPAVQERAGRLYHSILHPENVYMAVSDSPIDISKVRASDSWVRDINEFEPDLIIIDTLRKIHRMDEIDEQTVAVVHDSLARLFGGDVAICAVHHERKESESNRTSPEEERAAGSGAWLDNGDFGIRVLKDSRHKPARARVSFPRIRYAEDQEPVQCEIDTSCGCLMPVMTPASRAAQLAQRDPNIGQSDIAQVLMDEGLCQRAMAYRHAKRALGVE